MSLQDTFDRSLDGFFSDRQPTRIGLAVSGGGDSVALLALAGDWAVRRKVPVSVATVDHRLRPESADEVGAVAAMCRALKLPHEALLWQGWDRSGNLQDAARKARLSLIGAWARAHQIGDVATGHTRDDQAETVLMRLGRGSGVDGLTGIPAERTVASVRWIRPLLGFGREELRAYLRSEGIDWIDDPSNEDERFERVKIRHAMATLATLGVSPEGLADTARRMASAREVLDQATEIAARQVAKPISGDILLDIDRLFAVAAETRRRLLSHALNWVSGAVYAPRFSSLADLEAAIRAGKTATLHGCIISVKNGTATISREYQAVSKKTCKITEIWDSRWKTAGPGAPDLTVRALGEPGLARCPNWRDSGLPRASLLASPAIWRGDELVAAPLAGLENQWYIELIHSDNHFLTSILSH